MFRRSKGGNANHTRMNSQSTTRNTFLTLISLSQIGYAWWFFGNLYEALVKVPELLANSARLPSILLSGVPSCTTSRDSFLWLGPRQQPLLSAGEHELSEELWPGWQHLFLSGFSRLHILSRP